jgi:hypothetical protein
MTNTDGPWINAKSRNPRSTAIVQQPNEALTTHGIPVPCQFALPVANRYVIYQIDKNRGNLVTQYYPLNLSNHQN